MLIAVMLTGFIKSFLIMINVNFNEFDKFISCRVGSMSCGGHVNIVCLHSLFKLLKFFCLNISTVSHVSMRLPVPAMLKCTCGIKEW